MGHEPGPRFARADFVFRARGCGRIAQHFEDDVVGDGLRLKAPFDVSNGLLQSVMGIFDDHFDLIATGLKNVIEARRPRWRHECEQEQKRGACDGHRFDHLASPPECRDAGEVRRNRRNGGYQAILHAGRDYLLGGGSGKYWISNGRESFR